MKNFKRLRVIMAAALVLVGSTYAYERSATQTQMLSDLNAYRFLNGVSNLTGNDSLMQAAQDYACKLNAGAPYQHIEPTGIQPQDRMISAGYRGVAFGENLNKATSGMSTSAMAIFSRKASPGHKANMLSTVYDEVGVGQCGLYRVQNFGMSRKEFNYPILRGTTDSYDVDKFTSGMFLQATFDSNYTTVRNGTRIYFEPRTEIIETTTTRTVTNTQSTSLTSAQQKRLLDRLNKIYAKILNGKKLYIK